jgi:hypothetical protein
MPTTFLVSSYQFAAAPALPTDFANLQGWWDADNVSFSTGANISQFTDRSGNGAHATQATAAVQADQVADEFGQGIDGANFDSDDFYATGLSTSAARTWLIIIKPRQGQNQQFVVGEGVFADAAAGAAVRLLNGSTTTPNVDLTLGDGTNRVAVNVTVAVDTITYIVARYDSSGLWLKVNDETEVTAANTLGSLGTDEMAIGAEAASGGSSGRRLDSDLHTIATYARKFTDTERTQAMAMLQALVPA